MNVGSILDSGKQILTKGLAFGRKNAPILMTGSSIAIGWFAVYLFWKESKKADKRIEYEEGRLKEEHEAHPKADDVLELPKKEKVVIYLEYCWMSLLLGVASSGLAIAGQKLSMDRLVEAYAMMQFLSDKDKKREAVLNEVKEEVGEKKFNNAVRNAKIKAFEMDEIWQAYQSADDGVVIGDNVMHKVVRKPLEEIQSGLQDVNRELRNRYDDLKEKRIKKILKDREKDAFYVQGDITFTNTVSPDPDEDMYFGDLYSSMDLGEFLQRLHLIPDSDEIEIRIGEINEFRYYGGDGKDKNVDPIPWTAISGHYNVTLPNGEMTTVTILDYLNLLSPTYELMERNPI